MIIHVYITGRLNGEKEKWGAEWEDEKLLCLSVYTTYFQRLQDPEQAKGGRKPKVLAPLNVLTVRSQQLFRTQRSHQGSILSSYPS